MGKIGSEIFIPRLARFHCIYIYIYIVYNRTSVIRTHLMSTVLTTFCKIFTVSVNYWEGSKIHSNFTIRVYRNFQFPLDLEHISE